MDCGEKVNFFVLSFKIQALIYHKSQEQITGPIH